jgi:predicted TIM-barrel fold metal-dependent hydrolase
MIDGHIHLNDDVSDDEVPDRGGLLEKLEQAGMEGGVLLSAPPSGCMPTGIAKSPERRMSDLLSWVGKPGRLHPFFWIDPTEADAVDQVRLACGLGAEGFKVIPSRHAPCDPRAMKTYDEIARFRRPLLFHAGILWDGLPSSDFTRPAAYEGLLEIPGLRFSLAHAAWPWLDECIAVYGKMLHAHRVRSGPGVEMFIDTTPGTPPIYREELIRKLFTVGYDVEDNLVFGSDGSARDYPVEWTRNWVARDEGLIDRLHAEGAIQDVASVKDKYFGRNLARFLDGSPPAKARKIPDVAG